MKGRAGVMLALVAMLAAAVASTAGAGSSAVTASQAVNCNGTLKIGIITPLTGGAGFLGQEQLLWTQYALSRLAKPLGLKVQLVRGDTPVEKGPGEGLVVAQKMIADSRLVAVIGPATSGAVASASNALAAAGIAHISPSATRTSLTTARTRRRRRRSSASCPATTSRAPATRTSWWTSST
jgi:branched-chain amino acid transport system substrate-binding protein